MNQAMTFDAKAATKPLVRGLMVAALAVGAWALSAGMSQARASEVYWSVGVHSPGVQLGVSNAPPRPVYVQRPSRVYVQPAPVVVYPGYRHVRPVVVVPAPVYYQGAPRYEYVEQWAAPIGRRGDRHWREDKHRWKGHKRHDRHDRHSRHDRRNRHD
jgi:hypothetical protein